jgi:hypothetical protein
MSYRGEESGFQETEAGGDQDPNNWKTGQGANNPTAAYDTAYTSRTSCFLGIQCN